MKRMQHGFTFVEFILMSSIIAVATVSIFPDLFGGGNRAREAEVKSNIHAIQIALERYAVDTGGVYPTFLIGAERDSNIIRCSIDLQGNGVSQFPIHGQTPFAKVADNSKAVGPNNLRITMDPLIQFSYLSGFPVNPFTRRDTGMWNSSSINQTGMTGVFPYGGIHGDIMFDLGFGWGDTPQTDFVLYVTEAIYENKAQSSDGKLFSDPDLDAPGNFYYHPIFNDMIPVYIHYAAQYGAVHLELPDWANIEITSDEVAGYLLYGYGAPGDRESNVERGLDYFNRMPERDNLPETAVAIANLTMGIVLDTTVGNVGLQQRVEATGYSSMEYDPWTGAFSDGINPMNPGVIDHDRKSGSDGVLDWAIIQVSSGVDFQDDPEDDPGEGPLQFAT